MKKTKGLTATSLRSLLIFILIVLISAVSFGFYQAQVWLKEFAVSTEQAIDNSKSSTMSSEGISDLQSNLDSQKNNIDKAAAVLITGADYQSQLIKDLDKYASITGISITNYSIPETTNTAAISNNITGIISKYITITIQNPVSISNLIKFLALIETNLPLMQINGINLSQSSDNSSVEINPITIEIYTRQ